MELFGCLLLLFLFLRVGVVLVNLFNNPHLSLQNPEKEPLVSILIPVRNEAANLPGLFLQLSKLNYPHLEILVLNDFSEDNTEGVLGEWIKKDSRIRYFQGKDLPEGWLGKNWACSQLATLAEGRYLLFLDADVAFLHPELVSSSLAEMEQQQLALLSIFPDQIMESPGEKAVVPLMHFMLLSMLPIRWIFRLPFPSMAAANGQFMLFDAPVYRERQWHHQVKNTIVEDIAIMRKLKADGKRGMLVLANGLIKTRMYHGYLEGLEGFSKNMLAAFGNRIPFLLVYLSFIWGIIIWIKISAGVFIAAILAILFIRIVTSIIARQSVFRNIIYHPWQMINLLIIGILSIYKRIRKNNQWKGRNVQLS